MVGPVAGLQPGDPGPDWGLLDGACGPGVIWSVLPPAGLPAGGTGMLTERWSGGRLVLTDGTGTVVRLISGNPQDYLDPRFQPGAPLL